mgnify:CR=1 FL=1
MKLAVEPVKVGILIDYIEGDGGSDSMLEDFVLAAYRLAEDELNRAKAAAMSLPPRAAP